MKKRILSLATVLFIGGAVVLTSCGKDEVAPVITLKGDAIAKIDLGSTYTDAGVTADDNEDGDVTSKVTDDASTVIDTKKAGKYTVTYTVSDEKANTGTATREVWVVIKSSTLVSAYSCEITKSDDAAAVGYKYSDNVTKSSVTENRVNTSSFAGFSKLAAYLDLSGDLGTTVTVPSQTYTNVGTNSDKTKTVDGTGTVSEDGLKITVDYTIKDGSNTAKETVVYTKK